jgi:HSP20 family protein
MERMYQHPAPVARGGSRFYDLVTRDRWATGDGFLATDLFETDSAYVVKAVLPGVPADELKITRVGETLTIEGQVQAPPVGDASYLFRERSYGPFRRTIVLPEGAEGEGEATLEAGILTLEFAKRPEHVPHTIKVKSSES